MFSNHVSQKVDNEVLFDGICIKWGVVYRNERLSHSKSSDNQANSWDASTKGVPFLSTAVLSLRNKWFKCPFCKKGMMSRSSLRICRIYRIHSGSWNFANASPAREMIYRRKNSQLSEWQWTMKLQDGESDVQIIFLSGAQIQPGRWFIFVKSSHDLISPQMWHKCNDVNNTVWLKIFRCN